MTASRSAGWWRHVGLNGIGIVLMLLARNEAFGDVRLIACTNCAIVCANLGRIQDAFAWYDQGIALEARHPGSTAALWILLAASVAGLALVLTPGVAARVLRRLRPDPAERLTPSPGALGFGIVANGAAWIGYGIALWLLARGVLPAAGLGVVEAIGGFAASYIAGYLFLLAPNGLGVRESVFVIMLEPRIGLANALALAAVSRLGMTAADVLAALPFVRAFREAARHAV